MSRQMFIGVDFTKGFVQTHFH